MRLFTLEDLRDIYLKSMHRGFNFMLSKLSFSEHKRTKSSFNHTRINTVNWWDIPEVKLRWNQNITGDKNTDYETYISKIFAHQNIKLLSIGSGTCSHELKLAELNPNWDITCIDFSEKLIEKATLEASRKGLTNFKCITKDIYAYNLPKNYYSIVLFHSSLHHFKNLKHFIGRISDTLESKGTLIINEYVGPNRLQYNKHQLKEINNGLAILNKSQKKIHKSNLYKTRYFGSGLLRMIISDPSECVESQHILPEIYLRFNIIEEKGYGGNILMPLLKDIAHHFKTPNATNMLALKRLFEFEDAYLKQHKSDFIFGIYQKK